MTKYRAKPVDKEHQEQAALFKWAALVPELSLMFAIPNGGQRHKAVAAKLKAEGVKSGVPDICLPLARGGFTGLWIELKRPIVKVEAKPIASANQKWWIDALNMAGAKAVVCFGWDDARQVILSYIRRGE
jgi:hypothetical protein